MHYFMVICLADIQPQLVCFVLCAEFKKRQSEDSNAFQFSIKTKKK